MNNVERIEALALRNSVKTVTQQIRAVLESHNISSFRFEIVASGRTTSGEAKLYFELADNEYGSSGVKSNDIEAMVEEFLRRKGFDHVHQPLELPSPGTRSEDEAQS